jgi:Domain of unknown function (DUF5667)
MAADRRLAQEFDLALSAGPGTRSAQPGAQGDLVALAHRVGGVSRALPGMDELFRRELRARLVELTPQYAGAAAGVPPQRGARHAGLRRAGSSAGDGGTGSRGGLSGAWRRRLLAAGVGMAVATGSVGGVAIASSRAVPGDPLYSAKMMFENMQLSLSGSPTEHGEQYLKLADIRLGEVDSLLQRPDATQPDSPTAAYLAQTLDNLQQMIQDGGSLLITQVQTHGDQEAVRSLSDFLLTERQRVVDLTWQLPDTLQNRPTQIVALMDDLSRRLQQAELAMPTPGPGSGQGASGGVRTGAPGGSGTGQGTRGTQSPTGASGTGTQGATPSPTSSGSAAAGGTGGQSAAPSPSSGPSIGINLPLPILPSTGVNVPPLLPGLPGIDLDLGGPAAATPDDGD